MKIASIEPLDRWHLTVTHKEHLTEDQRKQLPLAMIDLTDNELPRFMKYMPSHITINNNPVIEEEKKLAEATTTQTNNQDATNNDINCTDTSKADIIANTQADEEKQSKLTDSHRIVSGTQEIPAYKAAEFNNYLSFGLDAQIIHKFHRHREANHGNYTWLNSLLATLKYYCYW
jgi:hypothetical protein